MADNSYKLTFTDKSGPVSIRTVTLSRAKSLAETIGLTAQNLPTIAELATINDEPRVVRTWELKTIIEWRSANGVSA
jgi:hypothetical protein